MGPSAFPVPFTSTHPKPLDAGPTYPVMALPPAPASLSRDRPHPVANPAHAACA